MKKIKKVGILSLGKVLAAIYAGFGLVFGVVFSIMSLVAAIAAENSFISILFAIGSLILLPLGYGLLGFVSGVVTAWIYNFVSKWTGGVEIELHD